MMDRVFAVLILTHGRAKNVKTFKTLRKSGYTGDVIFVLDNEDEQINDYKEKFGEQNIVVFDKKNVAVDTMDNNGSRNVIFFARNMCHKIAAEKGLTHFLELDDDYTSFEYRWKEDGKLKVKKFCDLDKVFAVFLECLDSTGALTIAMAQGGDFIGGSKNNNLDNLISRKAMNSFFCRTDRPFEFIGRINEDVNTYVTLGSTGAKIFTSRQASIVQTQTQKSVGGMTDAYLLNGTYVKSFYSVMAMPSAVKVSAMGDKHRRIHHKIQWDNCVPKILDEKYKK